LRSRHQFTAGAAVKVGWIGIRQMLIDGVASPGDGLDV